MIIYSRTMCNKLTEIKTSLIKVTEINQLQKKAI